MARARKNIYEWLSHSGDPNLKGKKEMGLEDLRLLLRFSNFAEFALLTSLVFRFLQ